MRIKIVRSPRGRVVDGVDLRRFAPGQTYDVGSQLGALLLAEGWAEPVAPDSPSGFTRETHPPSVGDRPFAADFQRRRSRRKR